MKEIFLTEWQINQIESFLENFERLEEFCEQASKYFSKAYYNPDITMPEVNYYVAFIVDRCRFNIVGSGQCEGARRGNGSDKKLVLTECIANCEGERYSEPELKNGFTYHSSSLNLEYDGKNIEQVYLKSDYLLPHSGGAKKNRDILMRTGFGVYEGLLEMDWCSTSMYENGSGARKDAENLRNTVVFKIEYAPVGTDYYENSKTSEIIYDIKTHRVLSAICRINTYYDVDDWEEKLKNPPNDRESVDRCFKAIMEDTNAAIAQSQREIDDFLGYMDLEFDLVALTEPNTREKLKNGGCVPAAKSKGNVARGSGEGVINF